MDSYILYTNEESMTYTKKERLKDLLFVGIAISHETIDKANAKVEEIKIL